MTSGRRHGSDSPRGFRQAVTACCGLLFGLCVVATAFAQSARPATPDAAAEITTAHTDLNPDRLPPVAADREAAPTPVPGPPPATISEPASPAPGDSSGSASTSESFDTAASLDRRRLRRTPVVAVFEACRESVVNISSTQIIQVRSPFGSEGLLDEFFDFPDGRSREVKRTSVGSGFVIHAAGYIVTNAHVVARTAERKVTFHDQREYDAQVVAIDLERDLAVLKVEADQPLQPLPLGTSSDLMVGETVIAIGNPLGYQHTVTTGVVSALERALELKNEVIFKGLIQTDAAINPGNSGGPLLNILGELIGINTAIRSEAENIGFAIPVDQLRRVLPELLDVERRYRLVTGLTVSPSGPCRVTEVLPDSPAAAIQLQVGDIITQVDDQPIGSAIDFHIELIGHKAGDRLQLRVMRGGRTGAGVLTLAQRPRPDGAALLKRQFGIEARPLTADMARALAWPGLSGLIVTAVDTASPADQVKLQRGDVIVQIGRYQPQSIDDVGELLEKVKTGQAVSITVLRVAGRVIYRSTVLMKAR